MMFVNPLHPNISMHILHTVLYTFPEVLTRGTVFKNQELYKLVIISFDSGVILWGEIRSWSLLGVKGLIICLLNLSLSMYSKISFRFIYSTLYQQITKKSFVDNNYNSARMEGLHFIMLLSMGAALELKLFSNKVMCICTYGHFFVRCTFLLPCVYTLWQYVNYIGFACSHYWENLVIKYLDSKRSLTSRKEEKS